jgi:predicted permease
MRNVMVVGQISAALVLVLATIVLVEDLRRLHDLRPGFDPDGVFQARVSIPPAYRTAADVARFYERLSEQIAAAPGVLETGVISIAPFAGLLAAVPFSIPGGSIADREKPYANLRAISPGYLSTVGTRLMRGRSFSEADRADTPAVVLVSAALADRFLSGPAVGQQLVINDNNQGPRPVEIVGVVENVRQAALDQPAAYDLYVPMRQIHIDWLSRFRDNQFWMVRMASDPAAFRTVFMRHLRTVDQDAAVAETGTMRESLEQSLGPRRFNLALLSTFALTAVSLAVIGLYGLVSYTVGQRAPEIGLRIAIGATPSAVQRMILRQAAILASVGIAFGVVIALVAGPLVVSVTDSTAANAGQQLSIDPSIAAAAILLLVGVVLAAAWLPARRAAKIEPTIALRAQ